MRGPRGGRVEALLNAALTLQAVWFYLACVHCYVDLPAFERGAAHAPYQHRLLLMLPLRWAHDSAFCNGAATALTRLHAWFPVGVRAESLVEFPVDVAALAVAGLVARRLYLAASPTGLLRAAVYPLTVLMALVTYGLGTMYRVRFVYDLPSLGFFAAGMYLLYFRRPLWVFAMLFTVATVNRETTLFLLVLFLLQRTRLRRRRWPEGRVGEALFVVVMSAGWAGWHVWVAHRYAANGTESWNRMRLNLLSLLVPFSWLQLLSVWAYCGPLLLLWRRRVHDALLRRWLWVIPLWFAFMLRYGLLLECRVFGELIPLAACCVTLGAESVLLERAAGLELGRKPRAQKNEPVMCSV